MARKDKESPTIVQDELCPPAPETRREEYSRPQYSRSQSANRDLDDARLVDLDADEESPFLRGQKRVSARRSALPRKTAHRLLWVVLTGALLCVAAAAATAVYRYGEHSWRFRVESSDNIDVTGTQNVTKAQIMEVMGADIGRNIFFIPLAQQKAQLEQIPWVESASVMRFVPNRLKVEIHERTPVAFARVGPKIFLIDALGTLMELPHNHKYSFPVILGMNPGEPLSTRAPRMKAYSELIRQLDSDGAHYSQDLSEVDLADLDDIRVRVNDPVGDVLVELGSSEVGSSDYLKRFKVYTSHVQEWRQQFQKLESVNLRYDNQVIVNPDIAEDPRGKSKPATLSAAAARAAVAAGVKPAALLTPLPARLPMNDRTLPKPAFELSPQKLEPRNVAAKSVSVKKTAGKAGLKKAGLKKAAPKPTKTQAAQKPMSSASKPVAHSAASQPQSGKPPQTSGAASPVSLPVVPKPSSKPSAAIAKQQGSPSSSD